MGRHGRLLAVLALAAWAGEASGAVVGRERAEAWELLLKYLVTTMARAASSSADRDGFLCGSSETRVRQRKE
jgi:hypothetical protein